MKWQIPLSLQNTTRMAHYFADPLDCPELKQAICGKWFNPTFAQIAKPGSPHCKQCAAVLAEETRDEIDQRRRNER